MMKLYKNFVGLLIPLLLFLKACSTDGPPPAVLNLDAGKIKSFKTGENGTLTRIYDHFAGELSKEHCRAYCGCRSFKFAAFEEDHKFCWCGDDEGELCDNTDCMTKIDASNYLTGFKEEPPAKVKLFETIDIKVNEVSGTTTYGLVQDGKLQIHNSSTIPKVFTDFNSTVVAEIGAFWGCQSEMKVVTGYINSTLDIICPSQVQVGEEFFCDVVVGGSDFLSLNISIDDTVVTTYTSVSESYIYTIGGDMETNRFEEYWESFEWATNENAAFINLNHEFHTDGKLKAFEAYITRKGCIRFMVVKPVCTTKGEAISNYLKICTTDKTQSNTNADDYNTLYPPANFPVLCMEQMRFTNAGNYTAPPMLAQDEIKMQFEVVYSYQVHADQLGTQTFVVPDNEVFHVKAGFMLGWIACDDIPGDIAYYHIDPVHEEMYRRYRYPEVTTTSNKAIFQVVTTEETVENYRELLQAVVVVDVTYEEPVNATKEVGDTYEMKVKLVHQDKTLELARTITVCEKVENLTTNGTLYEIKSGNNLDFSTAIQVDAGGACMTLCVNWGDGPLSEDADKICHVITQDKSTLNHTYISPGDYLIRIKAYNVFGNVTTTTWARALGTVDSLTWMDEINPIEPIMEKTELELCFVMKGSGRTTTYYNIHPANETNVVNTTISIDMLMADIVIVCLTKLIDYPVDLQCTVGVNDAVNKKNVTAIGVVEAKIENAKVIQTIVKTNETGLFEVDPMILGTNITFLWTWNDGTPDNQSESLNQMNMTHTYALFGNKTITLYSWNRISNLTTDSLITVQDGIQGLAFQEEPFHTTLGEVTKVYGVIEQGTGMTCTIYFLESDPTAKLELINLDVLGLMYFFGDYTYQTEELHNATISCQTAMDVQNMTSSFYVEVPVSNLTVDFTQEFTGGVKGFYDYIEENETLTLSVQVIGSNVEYLYDLGDQRIIKTLNTSLNISYPKWSSAGPYKVVVNASNHISESSVHTFIYVDQPVKEITGFQIATEPSSAEEPSTFHLTVEQGTLFNCTWVFSEGSEVFVTYNEFIENEGKVFVKMEPGNHAANINCSNRLFDAKYNFTAEIYAPASAFDVTILSSCAGKPLAEGIGTRSDMYPISCPIVFITSDQEGTKVSNHYDFGYTYENDTKAEGFEYPIYNFTHFFQAPLEQLTDEGFTITVKASNVITEPGKEQERTFKVNLINAIDPFTTTTGVNPDHTLGFFSNFSIMLNNTPYQVCCVLDLGVIPKEGEDPPTKFIFGHEICPSKPEYAVNHQYMTEIDDVPIELGKEPGKEIFVMRYKYKEEGLYTSSFTCSNPLSSITVVKEVKVTDLPCQAPSVVWEIFLGTSIKTAAVFYKCWKVQIPVVTVPDCLKPNTTSDHKWILEKVLESDGSVVSPREIVELEAFKDLTKYVKEKQEVAYGTYKLTHNATMRQHEDNVTSKVVPQTTTSIDGFFVIKACKLIAAVNGGNGKATAQKNNITIDASISSDPDIPAGEEMNLKFEWYCKQKNESGDIEDWQTEEDWVTYPEKAPHPDTKLNASMRSGNFKGCFGDRPGRLYGDTIFLPKKGQIRLELRYMLPDFNYTIFIRLSQNGRVNDTPIIKYDLTVTLEDVPMVTIVCTKNCDQQVNPSDELKLSALCDNCPKNIDKMYFDWKVLEEQPNKEFEQIQPPEGSIATMIMNGQAIFIANKGSFPFGATIKVVLQVKWTKDNKNTGFSLIIFKVNRPPVITNAACDVDPPSGEALATQFVINCAGVVDKDVPLKYYFYFNFEGEARQLIGFKQGKSISNEFRLPGGKIEISVQVIDVLQASSEFIKTNIEVNKFDLSSSQVDDLLSKASESGDAQTSGNVISALLSVMDSNPGLFDDERRQALQSSIINTIANIKVNSPDAATIVAQSVSDAINGNEGLANMEDVQKCLDSLDKMKNIAKEDFGPGKFKDLVLLTYDATAKATRKLSGNFSDTYLSQAMSLEQHMGSTIASEMLPGEKSIVFKTGNGDTEIMCKPMSKDDNTSLVIGSFRVHPRCVSDALFKIKHIVVDADGYENSEGMVLKCVPSVTTFGRNRFYYDREGTDNIKDGTADLDVFSKATEVLKIKDCEHPIEVIINNTQKAYTIPPSEAYGEIIKEIHTIKVTYNETSIFIYATPVEKNYDGQLFLFLNKDFSPSLIKHDANCTVPNPYPAKFRNMTSQEQHKWKKENRWRCFIRQGDLGQMTKGTWLAAVINVPKNFSGNITQKLIPRDTDPLLGSSYPIVNYTFEAFTRACMFRDKVAWISRKGDEPSGKCSKDTTVCLSRHLSVFGGGGPFAIPNPIDFSKAFANFTQVGENPTVFSIVIAILVLYVLMVIWARRQDLKDLKKRKVCELDENHPEDSYFYEISIQTGVESGGSTTADVFIILQGDLSESAPRHLKNPQRRCFKRNDTDVFLFSSPLDLGNIGRLQIWHNNTGGSPGWFLTQIQVEDLQNGEKHQFICNNWLDVAEGDGAVHRTLEKAEAEDLLAFDYLFTQTTRQFLYNDHIWLSVFMRPAQSNFTRVQRLTTCFSLFLTYMLSNAMFYRGVDKPTTDSIKLGIYYVSFEEVRIAFTAALIVIPIHLLIIVLFKKAGPPTENNKYARRYGEGNLPSSLDLDISDSAIDARSRSESSGSSKRSHTESMMIKPDIDDDVEEQKDNMNCLRGMCVTGREDAFGKQRKALPHWLIYVAYLLCFLSSVASGFFVILYGFQFGKTKSDQWIISMFFSFWQSVLILQPLKVLIISVIFAILLKEPPRVEETSEGLREIQRAEKKDLDDLMSNDPVTQHMKRHFYKLPDERRLEESRNQRFKDMRIKVILKEILVHLSFVVLCLMVCYAAVDPNAQRLYQSAHTLMGLNGITNTYFGGETYQSGDRDALGRNKPVQDGPSVSTRAEWFDWARYSVIEYLFPIGWYNSKETGNKFKYKAGFIADAASSKVLAMARFRQLRLQDVTCEKHDVFKYLIKDCNGPYSYANQMNQSFNEGWSPLNETENMINRAGKRATIYQGIEDPWKYSSMEKLQNTPFFGRFATYDGASYSVSIGPKKRIAKKIIYAMKDKFWIDRKTRAIFTEANIYNANTNMLLMITFLHEILPTGGWNYYPNVQAIRLYRYVGGMGDLIIFFDIAFLVVTFYGLYKIIKRCKNEGCKDYLSDPWNMLHTIVTFCSLSAFLITILRVLDVKDKIRQYRDNPEIFVSFTIVSLLENLTIAFLGFVLFFKNLEFLRILRFNIQIALMSKTMSSLGAPLGSFGMIFVVLFMSYVSLSHCLFVDKLEDFKSPMETLVSLSRMFMGQFSIGDYFDNAPYLGPILFFTYMISIQMVMINLFIGLICDAFAESGEGEDDDDEEKPNIFNFMKDQVKSITNNGMPVVEPIYSDWKDEWELMMERLEENCESSLFLLRNMESEETRQAKFFDDNIDQKKKDLITAVIGIDYFNTDIEFSDGIQVIEKKWKDIGTEGARKCLYKASAKKCDTGNELDKQLSSRDSNATVESELEYTDNEDEESGNESDTN